MVIFFHGNYTMGFESVKQTNLLYDTNPGPTQTCMHFFVKNPSTKHPIHLSIKFDPTGTSGGIKMTHGFTTRFLFVFSHMPLQRDVAKV